MQSSLKSKLDRLRSKKRATSRSTINNLAFEGYSLWESALYHLYWSFAEFDKNNEAHHRLALRWAEALKLLLHCGVDPYLSCRLNRKAMGQAQDVRSARSILQGTISQWQPHEGFVIQRILDELKATTSEPTAAAFRKWIAQMRS